MPFFLIVGTNDLYLYEKDEENLKKQFIEGLPFYSYDINNCEADLTSFLDALVNEKNLAAKSELEFIVVGTQNRVYTETVQKILENYVRVNQDIEIFITLLLNVLAKDQSLKIDEYGINYGDVSYRLGKGKLLTLPFDLLAYTVDDESVVNLLDLI